MLKWIINGGNKKAVDNSPIRNDSIKGNGRTAHEIREILDGNDNDWKKGYSCASKGSRENFDWCYYSKKMYNSKGEYPHKPVYAWMHSTISIVC